jgi:hypothetical protein
MKTLLIALLAMIVCSCSNLHEPEITTKEVKPYEHDKDLMDSINNRHLTFRDYGKE